MCGFANDKSPNYLNDYKIPYLVGFPDFKPVEIEDKQIFDEFFLKYPPSISEFTFTNIFSWRLAKKHEFSVLDSHLIISFFASSKRKFYQPVGAIPEKIMLKIFEKFPDSSFERVEKGVAEKLTNLNVRHDRDMDDYIYKLSELMELKGDKYSPKRNFIRRCEEYSPQVCILDDDTAESFFEMQEKWCSKRNCSADKSLYAEDIAVKEALANFKEFNLFGICVRINNKIAAFAIGEPLNKNIFVEHFEKADPSFVGIHQYLLHKFVSKIPERFEFINREQDLGIEGIRKSKLSYYPIRIVEKFSVRKKS